MCLILLSFHQHPEYQVIIAANRDEFYNRPAVQAAFWKENPEVVSGRDLQGGGTWLGLSKKGRIAMITNYREPGAFNPDAPTRGKLVSNFLSGQTTALNYLEQLESTAQNYNGFNLILGDDSGFYYLSNRIEKIKKLSHGLFGLSNHLLDTPWPKMIKSKNAFVKVLERPKISEIDLFNMLSDVTYADESQLPDTGAGIELEKKLSPVFIKSPKYGTRCSTLILVDKNAEVRFIEKTYDPLKENWSEVRYQFKWNGRL